MSKNYFQLSQSTPPRDQSPLLVTLGFDCPNASLEESVRLVARYQESSVSSHGILCPEENQREAFCVGGGFGIVIPPKHYFQLNSLLNLLRFDQATALDLAKPIFPKRKTAGGGWRLVGETPYLAFYPAHDISWFQMIAFRQANCLPHVSKSLTRLEIAGAFFLEKRHPAANLSGMINRRSKWRLFAM